MATQKGRNWSSGDIVTAANLSSIERGVSAVAEEYTPTTWANGDTVTAAALNNIEQGIANAGGGSSDFSTAQVTTIMNLGVIRIPYLYEDDNESVMVDLGIEESGTYNVPMYKGVLVGEVVGMDIIVQVSGNAEWNENFQSITITGDCTITISDSSSGQAD